ncbi:GL18492 [Drosophila persimilis]|uniref:GL18492 n=1 Tax=Drosophila persimilis TaxID=7234 RepID=B4ISJ5_DROPE|nr:GL18492 [Drosophila persimilis]
MDFRGGEGPGRCALTPALSLSADQSCSPRGSSRRVASVVSRLKPAQVTNALVTNVPAGEQVEEV